MSNVADYTYDYSNVQWDASGKPYVMSQSGKRAYLPPAQAAQMQDPRLRQWAASMGQVISRDDSGNATGVVSNAAPSNTFAHQNNGWNAQTGQFDQSLNQGGLLGLIEGGSGLAGTMFAGPALANLVEGGAGAFPEPVAAAMADPAALTPAGLIPTTTAPGIASAAASGTAIPAAGGASATGASMAGSGATGFLGSMQNLLTDPKFLFNTGANLIGAGLGAHAAGKAADQQAKAAAASLDLQKNIYEQQRSDQMPWLNAGRGAVSTLSRLMGVDGVNPASALPQTSPQPQQAVQRSPLAQLAGGGGMVNMRAPDGSTRPVPAAQVAQLEARGAVRVG